MTYSFSHLALGTYRIRQVVPTGWAQVSPNPKDIQVVQAVNINRINFTNSTPTVRTPQSSRPHSSQLDPSTTFDDPLLSTTQNTLLG